jgi:hypothetical protein
MKEAGIYFLNNTIFCGKPNQDSPIDMNEPIVFQHVNFTGYYKYILQQANLTALKEISGNIIIFGLSVIIVLLVILAYRKIMNGLFCDYLISTRWKFHTLFLFNF